MNDIRSRFKKTDNKSDDIKPSYNDRPSSDVQKVKTQSKPPVVTTPSYKFPKTIPKSLAKQARKKQRRRKFTKRLAVLFLLVFLAFVGVLVYQRFGTGLFNKKGDSNAVNTALPNDIRQKESVPEELGVIRLIATGDMIAHSTVLDEAKRDDNTYDFFEPMKGMKPFFESSDVRFCNQATMAGGPDFEYTGYPSFNAPFEWTLDMIKVGCNVVNIGTNHTNDKGQRLINKALTAWDNQPDVLAVAGANRSIEEQAKTRYFTAKGLKFAFLSYTTYSNNTDLTSYGVNMYTEEVARRQIKEARENAQFVLVSMRWGTEYSPDIDDKQDQISKFLAEQGVDIVLGHGPHVLGSVKRLPSIDDKETIVWYSLGNFLNTQIPIETLVGGFAVMDIDGPKRRIKDISFMPVYMHYDWSAQDRNNNNLGARRNLRMVPLDKAEELLASSTHNTSASAQQARIKTLLNKFSEVKMLTSETY